MASNPDPQLTQAPAGDSSRAPWDDPGWLEDVEAWLTAHAKLDGPFDLKLRRTRPWSVVVRVQTADGLFWLKQLSPSIASEAALTEVLARLAPDCIPEVLAVEGGRMLMRHAGPRLDKVADTSGAGPIWDEVVARHAELQIQLIPVAAELDAPDGRPETLARQFGEQVDPLVESLGDAIPVSLTHLSVNARNVCMRDGSPVFLDWDHSLLAHPLCGLVSTLRVFVRHLGAEPGGPEVLRVRDAYLEPWTIFAPANELRRIFPIASALGDLCRAVLWERKLALLPAAVREKHDFNIDRRVSDFTAALDAPDMLGA